MIPANPASLLIHACAANPVLPSLLVLDTNICLDLFIFDDVHTRPLLAALQQGRVQAVTREDCRAEYLHVLHYPHLRLDDGGRARAQALFDQTITCSTPPAKPIRLPVCSDKDDQKFLEATRDFAAPILLSKDKALLKLARKTRQANLFAILNIHQFNQIFSLTTP